MTAATLTLSEFLLARIAEDEARVRDEGIHPGGPSGLGSVLPDWEERRWLAECEAKRRIVEEHRPDSEGLRCGCCWLDDHQTWEPHPCPTMRALGVPFADHEDYRDEWRP